MRPACWMTRWIGASLLSAFGAVFKARVQAMGIRDRPTSFRSPWQNGHVERLIGSARHECTDHVIVFNEEHLRRILSKYTSYYNEVRTHLLVGKDAPYTRPIERFGHYRATDWLRYELFRGRLSEPAFAASEVGLTNSLGCAATSSRISPKRRVLCLKSAL
jgi:hypothetical protein